MTAENPERAKELLARALRTLEHVVGRSKQDQRGLDTVKQLVEVALSELNPPTQPALRLVLPPGTAEGRKNVRAGDWAK